MAVEVRRIRKFLNKKISQLNDIVADIDSFSTEMGAEYYRVAIFGSARIKADTKEYNQAKELAFKLSKLGVDIVTGGGPGLMEAANIGAKEACTHARSIGLPIELSFESDANSHLDVKYQHRRFSSRLDEFMRMSHAVIVTPGGIGTLLELLYTWQLLQVGHISPRPLLLLGGDLWEGLLKWIQNGPLKQNLMDQKDMEKVAIVNSVDEIVTMLKPAIEEFRSARLKP